MVLAFEAIDTKPMVGLFKRNLFSSGSFCFAVVYKVKFSISLEPLTEKGLHVIYMQSRVTIFANIKGSYVITQFMQCFR